MNCKVACGCEQRLRTYIRASCKAASGCEPRGRAMRVSCKVVFGCEPSGRAFVGASVCAFAVFAGDAIGVSAGFYLLLRACQYQLSNALRRKGKSSIRRCLFLEEHHFGVFRVFGVLSVLWCLPTVDMLEVKQTRRVKSKPNSTDLYF